METTSGTHRPDFALERTFWSEAPQDANHVLGIDETGYGSAVGSLCVAGVMFPPNMKESELPAGLRDSKKMSDSQRRRVYQDILDKASAVFVEFGSLEEIDATNVLATNLRCMQSIMERASPKPCHVLIDGNRRPKGCQGCEITTVVKGDSVSASIAAASVVAKVSRDDYVMQLAADHPELQVYQIAKNKGYLSEQHRKALDEQGRTPWHRQSYKYGWQQKKKISEETLPENVSSTSGGDLGP